MRVSENAAGAGRLVLVSSCQILVASVYTIACGSLCRMRHRREVTLAFHMRIPFTAVSTLFCKTDPNYGLRRFSFLGLHTQ